MKVPLRITSRSQPLSEAVRDRINERAAKLDQFFDKVIGCSVTLDVPNARRSHGKLYSVKIDVTVPGQELVVTHEAGENLTAVIGIAFDAAERQLEDYVHRRRGEVKKHD